MRAANTYGTKLPSQQPAANKIQPFVGYTYEEIATACKVGRHIIERTERRGMEKLVNGILSDVKIRNRYDGDIVAVAKAICNELGLTMKHFIKYADKNIIKRYWVI